MTGNPRITVAHASPLTALRPRERTIFEAFADAVVAPEPPLPPIHHTDATEAFAANLAAAPRRNRLAVRVLLHALDAAPLATAAHGRLHRLSRRRRTAFLTRLDDGHAAPATKALRSMAHLAYYGDADVMRALGYVPRT